MSKIFLPRMKPGAGMGKKSNMKDMDKTMFEIRMSAFFHNILYYSSHVFSYVHAAYMWVRSQFGCKVTKKIPNEQIFSHVLPPLTSLCQAFHQIFCLKDDFGLVKYVLRLETEKCKVSRRGFLVGLKIGFDLELQSSN